MSGVCVVENNAAPLIRFAGLQVGEKRRQLHADQFNHRHQSRLGTKAVPELLGLPAPWGTGEAVTLRDPGSAVIGQGLAPGDGRRLRQLSC